MKADVPIQGITEEQFKAFQALAKASEAFVELCKADDYWGEMAHKVWQLTDAMEHRLESMQVSVETPFNEP